MIKDRVRLKCERGLTVRKSGYAMSVPFSKGFVPDRRSGASPRFTPIMLATLKMKTPHSADPFSSTRICTGRPCFLEIAVTAVSGLMLTLLVNSDC